MSQPRADADPSELVTAYCAPGLRNHAARLLESRGEHYGELIEHPYLAGQTSVILTTNPRPSFTADDITATLR